MPNESFDPKPAVLDYIAGRVATAGGSDLLVDIGDPMYLYYHDVLGNAMYGALAVNILPGSIDTIASAINSCPIVCGGQDLGDDIVLRAGARAGEKYGANVTLDQVLASVRSVRNELLGAAKDPLFPQFAASNKIVPRSHVVWGKVPG